MMDSGVLDNLDQDVYIGHRLWVPGTPIHSNNNNNNPEDKYKVHN